MADPNPIDDALPTLLAGAIATYEMFKAYVEAGFSRPEALQLIAYLLKANQTPPAP
jgi:hypothetical protein